MKPHSITLILLVFSVLTYAQKADPPGEYILLPTGERSYGQVNLRNQWDNSVIFKPEGGGESRQYGPGDISGFFTEKNERYRSFQPDEETNSGPVFVKVLVEGPASLYFRDGIFYLQKGDEVLELRKEDKIDMETRTITYDNRYLGKMNYIFSDCEAMKNKIGNVSFDSKALSKKVIAYNKCIDPDFEPVTYKSPSPFRFGLKAGAINGRIVFPNIDNPFGLDRFNFPHTWGFSAGAMAKISLSQTFSCRLEFLATYKGGSASRETRLFTEVFEFSNWYAEIPITVHYLFPTRRYRPYVFGGLVSGFILSYSATGTQTSEINGNTTIITERPIGNAEFGYQFGAGLLLDRPQGIAPFLEYRFEQAWSDTFNLPSEFRYRFTSHGFYAGIWF